MVDFSSIGEKLKNIRTGMGLSLSEVSLLTGVSKAMLSQIERSESIPTLATTWKIANGLRIKFDTLFEDPNRLLEVKNLENATLLTEGDDKFLMYCMFSFTPQTGFDFSYGILKPGCNHNSAKSINRGTEHIIVTQGELELVIGETTHYLQAGNAIAFDALQPHIYRNPGASDTILCLLTMYE